MHFATKYCISSDVQANAATVQSTVVPESEKKSLVEKTTLEKKPGGKNPWWKKSLSYFLKCGKKAWCENFYNSTLFTIRIPKFKSSHN